MSVKFFDIDHDNEGFEYAEKLIRETNHSVFLTGKAGTGKSTFLKYMARKMHKNHVTVAPTGIAAINVRGVTIHSFFQLPFGPLLPYDERLGVIRFRPEKQKIIDELQVLIIDEISMVRADVMDAMDKVLRLARKRLDVPFGGVQLLMVGDLFQLEPVASREEWPMLQPFFPTTYFFSADVIRELDLVNIELTRIYRQDDAYFIEILNRIRSAEANRDDLEALNERYSYTAHGNEDYAITLATTRKKVSSINENALRSINAPLHEFKGKIDGDFPRKSLPTDETLQLKENAQVMFIKNDMGEFRKWANGTLGIIDKIDEDGIFVKLKSGKVHKINPVVWENIEYEFDAAERRIKEKVVGTYTQYPVKLAWAITIHKSQGLTFDNIILDLGYGAFAAGQLYVALSRCTSLNGIYLRTRIKPKDMIVRQEVVEFCEKNNDMNMILRALKE